MPEGIKGYWPDYPVPTPDLGGDGITARGGDPQIDTGGSDAVQRLWNDAPVSTPGGSETSNSMSGLPSLPARNQPSETPPEPPSIKDRSVTTLDKK